ncbi:TRAP transporter large permease subunit [Chloroflexota bacterium]
MEWYVSLSAILAALIIILSSGMPVAFGFLVLNIGCLLLLAGGERALMLISSGMWSSLATFTLVPLPLFLLMGAVLFESGVTSHLFSASDKWIGRIRARLWLVSIATGTVLGALTGAAMASVGILGTILYPDMIKRGYDQRLSIGTLLGSGSLAAIIPPSGLAVLLGGTAGISVTKLLLGGIVPGLLLAMLFAAYLIIISQAKPQLAPLYTGPKVPFVEKVKSLWVIAPFGFIVFSVLGVLLLGIATPSEASALGVVSCIIVAAGFRSLNFTVLKNALTSTMRVTGMMLMVFMAAISFSQVLSLVGATRGLAEWVTNLGISPLVALIIMQATVFALACFIDQVSIIMVTMPIFMPLVSALNIDPVVFGLLYLINVTLGGITPPFGLVLFVAKGVIPDASVGVIYRAAVPFILLTLLAMGIMIAFPQIFTWLPNLIIGG